MKRKVDSLFGVLIDEMVDYMDNHTADFYKPDQTLAKRMKKCTKALYDTRLLLILPFVNNFLLIY